MEFKNLKKQYESIKDEIDSAINAVITETNFVSGKQIIELEKTLSSYVGTKYCITCANGTDALSLALLALEITSNDAVFVPDFTFFASGEVVSFIGATPIFVDVEESTYNISISCLESAIQKVIAQGILTPKVIIAVDLFGQPANYGALYEIAQKYNLYIIEDGAQSFGGMIDHQRACSFGDISTTSFFPVKPLGCYGDGGAIFTNSEDYAKIIRSLSIHGKGQNKYDNVRIGMNSRLDTLQAAILLPKFNSFCKYELEAVNTAAEYYSAHLYSYVTVPTIRTNYYSSWAQYTIQLANPTQRNTLQNLLKENSIPSMVYYPKPLHKQIAFSAYHYDDNDFPVTTKLCNCVLSLPLHPYISKKEQDTVIKIIESVCKSS